jgi:hypothetical protein
MSIAAGEYHTCALLSNGGAKCWGDNDNYGQVGDGTKIDRLTPVDVVGLSSNVTAITTSWDYTCALLSGGGVKCWGDNWMGQLGDGTTSNYRPIPVDTAGLLSGATAITTGEYHTCALVGNGRPKCWGFDAYDGRLGVGGFLQYLAPVSVLDPGPILTINYPSGQPGSFFTITGWVFPPDGQATLSINGQTLTTTLQVNPTGSFIVFLDAASAEAGGYTVVASADGLSAAASFRLAEEAALRVQEGGGIVFSVPGGMAYHNFVYFPLVGR